MRMYKITTITSSVSYPEGTIMNLYNIAKFIPIDDTVVGLKYLVKPGHVLVRGKYNACGASFYNQISLVMFVNDKNVNVKIFKNGTLHITGCKQPGDPVVIARILEGYYTRSQSVSVPAKLYKTSDNVLVIDDDMLYSRKTQQVFGYVERANWINALLGECTTYCIGTDKAIKHRDFLLSVRTVSNRRVIYNLDGEKVGYTSIRLHGNCRKLFKHKNLVVDYNTDNILVGDICIGRIIYNISGPTCTTRTPHTYSCSMYQSGPPLSDPVVNINCINVVFNTGFKINRQILYEHLESDGRIVMYDPQKYSGVRLVLQSGGSRASFMIFHSGNVIGSGFKNIESIDAYIEEFKELVTNCTAQITCS